MRQVRRRWGWSRVTTNSFFWGEPICCATCQVLYTDVVVVSVEVGDCARLMVAETRARIKKVMTRRMFFWGLVSLLKLRCVDEKWGQAFGWLNL
jgi:hypothetical protein